MLPTANISSYRLYAAPLQLKLAVNQLSSEGTSRSECHHHHN